MWQEELAESLRDEIEAVLALMPNVRGLRDLVREPLKKAGRALSVLDEHELPWPLLPLLVHESISGKYDRALPVAASIQFLMAACDVFDDIEDADSIDSLPSKYGNAVATNVATALLFLGEQAILRLNRQGVNIESIIRIMEAINLSYTIACAGQHLDLSSLSEYPFPEETYLEVISMKSASQIECACRVGAMLASNNQGLVDIFATFGHDLGMAAQITNDIQGAISGGDITRRKITLPIIYALTQSNGEVRRQLELAFFNQSKCEIDPNPIKDLLFRTGAIQYATIKMQCYKQQAMDIASKAESAGVNVGWMTLFWV